MKTLLLIGFLIVGVFLYLATRHLERAQRADPRVSLPQVATADPVAAALEAQCAAQARKSFVALGYKESALTFFANHYNHTLDTYFLEIVSNSEGLNASEERQVTHHERLLEAYEKSEWGEYRQSTSRKQQPPPTCTITQPGRPRITCYSNDEFSDLVRRFME